MPLFQKSVLKKYLNELQEVPINLAYTEFQKIFSNPAKQRNILASKEEQYQEGFLRELFVHVLGYTLNPDEDYNLITEQKNEKNSKKADGAIISGMQVLAVIELKSSKTVDLTSIESQAFDYKNNQRGCSYVITSNFRKLRFYIDNAVEFEEFDLFKLNLDDFKLLWICLSADYLLRDVPAQIRFASNNEEENVTKKLYGDYAIFRKALFQDITEKNPQFDRFLLFKKTQKLLDRFLFLFFAEDRGLVSPNWTRKILHDWTDLKDRYDHYLPLYERFKKNFDYLNTGYSGRDGDVFAYNGGLFAPDEVLDTLTIDDDLLYNGSLKLSNYDFETEVDVNILGHIFEHSLNELDEIQATLEDCLDDEVLTAKKVTRRKKDGVFYTPKYITKYIVETTIGALCQEQKVVLDLREQEFEFIDPKARGKKKTKREYLNRKLTDYRQWLLELKIVDPACGSGAFLNQALEFLIAEHKKVDELRVSLLGGSLVLSDIENSILENNLYGVDVNEEAIEIAKLSLWLRTARKGRKLSSLNKNIKCGNSLIDDATVVGESAFSWNDAFPNVFENGGFNVVIGNPPYVPTEFISDIEKTFLERTYISAFGRINLYPIFYEKGLILLQDGGKLGFITPYTILKNQYFIQARRYILNNANINTLIDFTGNSVFKDATVDSIVLILTKGLSSNNSYTQVTNVNDFLTSDFIKLAVSQDEVFENEDLSLIISAYDSLSRKLTQRKDCLQVRDVLDFKQGIITGGNDKHITKEKSERTKKLLTGSDFNRYSLVDSGNYIIYDTVKLHRPRTPSIFEPEEKILLRQTGSFPICTIDDQQYYTLDTIHNGLLIDDSFSLRYLLALLNSKLLRFVYENSINEGGKVFAQVKIIYINPLPIKKISYEEQKPFIEQVTYLLNTNKSLTLLSSKFLGFLRTKIDGLKMNSRLEKWFILSPIEFFKELTKQKKHLSLSEQSDWLQYFEEYKSKALEIYEQILQIDKGLDRMIYDLYELTDEERQIIENA